MCSLTAIFYWVLCAWNLYECRFPAYQQLAHPQCHWDWLYVLLLSHAVCRKVGQTHSEIPVPQQPLYRDLRVMQSVIMAQSHAKFMSCIQSTQQINNFSYTGLSTTICGSHVSWRAWASWVSRATSCLWCTCCWRRLWCRAHWQTCVTVLSSTLSTHCESTARDVLCCALPSATINLLRTSFGGLQRVEAPLGWGQAERSPPWRGV